MSETALTGKERVTVQGQYNGKTPSGITFETTTQAIANLAGGLGGGKPTHVDDGVLYITDPSTDTFVVWNTVDSGSKITKVTTAGLVDGQTLVIKDYGARTFANTIEALEGGVTIELEASFRMNSFNGQSVNLKWDATNSNLMVF